MRTIQSNELAYTALTVGDLPLVAGVTLGSELRAYLDSGLMSFEGVLIFAASRGSWPGAPSDVQAALKRMAWRDLTMYECQYNSFHLEDYTPIEVTVTDKNEPRISEADQVVLLRLGLLVADHVITQVRDAHPLLSVRCIIGAGMTNATFRFHQIRDGESWLFDDLDAYRQEKIVVVDSRPPEPARRVRPAEQASRHPDTERGAEPEGLAESA